MNNCHCSKGYCQIKQGAMGLGGGYTCKDLEKPGPHTLHRKEAASTSIVAAHTVDAVGRAQLVLNEVIAAGERGATIKEITALHPEVPYPSISARPGALLKDGLIEIRGDKRDGARIMRAKAGTIQEVNL